MSNDFNYNANVMKEIIITLIALLLGTTTVCGQVNNMEKVDSVSSGYFKYYVMKESVTGNTYAYVASLSGGPYVPGGIKYPAKLDIPSSIKYNNYSIQVRGIYNSAFQSCDWLEQIKLPSVMKEICDNAFASCGKLKVIFPSSLSKVGVHAFKGTSIIDADFSQVSFFDNYGLEGCDIENITIGPWLNKRTDAHIGSYCFKDTYLKNLYFMEQKQRILMPVHAISYCDITELKLPQRAYVASEAIYRCRKLERVIFPETDSLFFIGMQQSVSDVECCYAKTFNVISDCPVFKEIVAMNPYPLSFYWWGAKYDDILLVDDYSQCVLKVPQGSEDLYRADPVWGRFERIEGFAPGEYTGISEAPVAEVESEVTPVYYNLQGMQVKEPVKGQLYIRRTGTKTAKIAY